MRGPDAEAGGEARADHPGRACPLRGRTGTVEQVDGGAACQEAHQPRQDDETQVVLAGQARENAEHSCNSPSEDCLSAGAFRRLNAVASVERWLTSSSDRRGANE